MDRRSDDASVEGRLLRQILDAFAEFEAAKIAVRTRAAHASRRTRGLLAPYGFRSEGERPHKRLVPVPHEQAALARIRELAAKGSTQRDIAAALTAERFKPRGARWHVTSVCRTLRPSP